MSLPRHISSNQRGTTYLILMFLIVVMSIGASAAVKQWKTVVQREKEADLLAHGIEIQTAIGAYSTTMKQGRVVLGELYPLSLEELTKPPKPLLRRFYKDPITTGDWEIIRDPATNGVKGVRSVSTLTPIKQHQFPPAVAHFESLTHYNEWFFQHPSPSMAPVPQSPANQPVSPQPEPAGGPMPTGPGSAMPFPQ
jgi:type II secretory pathway pseudopilin PulG